MLSIFEGISQSEVVDTIQRVALKLITSTFFLWTCLVLLLSQHNWKRPINFLLIVHWVFRSIGDMLEGSLTLFERKSDAWPYNNEGWLYSYGVASLFWFSSEIIGDWYLLIRTKVLIKNKKKLRWVFVMCISYNVIKITQIIVFMKYIPFRNGYNYEDPHQGDYYVLDMARNKLEKWVNVAIQQIFSIAYDITVIVALKKNVFNKMKDLKSNQRTNENTFLLRFKQISEYRIYLSILVTIIGAPFIFGFCIEIIYLTNQNYSLDDHERLGKLGTYCNDAIIDSIRVCILNFNYVFMYIDQIMLRFYVETNNKSKQSSSNNSNSINNDYNKNKFNFNMIYHDHKNYDELDSFNANKTIYYSNYDIINKYNNGNSVDNGYEMNFNNPPFKNSPYNNNLNNNKINYNDLNYNNLLGNYIPSNNIYKYNGNI